MQYLEAIMKFRKEYDVTLPLRALHTPTSLYLNYGRTINFYLSEVFYNISLWRIKRLGFIHFFNLNLKQLKQRSIKLFKVSSLLLLKWFTKRLLVGTSVMSTYQMPFRLCHLLPHDEGELASLLTFLHIIAVTGLISTSCRRTKLRVQWLRGCWQSSIDQSLWKYIFAPTTDNFLGARLYLCFSHRYVTSSCMLVKKFSTIASKRPTLVLL